MCIAKKEKKQKENTIKTHNSTACSFIIAMNTQNWDFLHGI